MARNGKTGGGNAARPIVLKSPGGQVELGAPDSRGRYTVKVTDKSGNVELQQTVTHDRYSFAQAITTEYESDGGKLRRRP
jgi:hypothetical protein